MNATDLSIILLTMNGGPLFAEVLAGLFACQGILEAEVLMIDSGSTDRTIEYASRYPHIRVHQIPSSEFGHGKTRNLGASLTTRPVIVYLVQDATPASPSFLLDLTAPLKEEGVAAVFGRQLARPWTNRIEQTFLRLTYPDRREVRAYSGSGPLSIRDIFFSNVCSAMRRGLWEQIHFDESLIMSEDQMWAKQALLAGHHIVYEPQAAVFHSHNYRLKEVFKRNFDSGASLTSVVTESFKSMIGYELRYLAASISDLARSGDCLSIPYLFAYEATRAVAVTAGQQAHLLPRRMKRMLSLHKYHWATDQASG